MGQSASASGTTAKGLPASGPFGEYVDKVKRNLHGPTLEVSQTLLATYKCFPVTRFWSSNQPLQSSSQTVSNVGLRCRSNWRKGPSPLLINLCASPAWTTRTSPAIVSRSRFADGPPGAALHHIDNLVIGMLVQARPTTRFARDKEERNADTAVVLSDKLVGHPYERKAGLMNRVHVHSIYC